MADEKLLSLLEEIGLSDVEAAVYYASLSLGPAAVSAIAKTAGIKRTSAYSIIERLEQKQLVFEEHRGFKRLFVASHPEKLASLLKERERAFHQALPDFSALYNLKGGESSIKHYQGLDAMKDVYEGLLDDVGPRDYYLVVSNMERWYGNDPDYFQGFIERRAKKARALDIEIRMLFQDNPTAHQVKAEQARYAMAVRVLPSETMLTTNLVVIPKKVVIQSVVPPITAMVIDNPNIVQMHKELFEIIWQSTPG